MNDKKIILKGVRVHNLKNVNLELTPNQLIVFTGVSGSGKSSLAFDTIYVEGQRRYIESLSTYARRQLGGMSKPDADFISGISPTIAIEQKTAGRTPRSIVGTMTGIYDYLRVLFARVGIAHCPISHEVVTPRSLVHILYELESMEEGTKIVVLSPYAKGKKGEFKEDFQDLLRRGFTRIRLDGKLIEITDEIAIDKSVAHDIDLIIDRITITPENKERLSEAVTQALELGSGVMSVINHDTEEEILYSTHAFSEKSGISYGPLEPHDFSFNHPLGMCPTCQGLGETQEFDLDLVIDKSLSIAEDCCKIASPYATVRYGNIYDNLARLYHFNIDAPWKKLPEKAQKVFLEGTEKKWTKMHFVHPKTGSSWVEHVQWRGVLAEAKHRFTEAKSEGFRTKMKELMVEMICPSCHGARIKPYPAATTLGGKRIHELCALSISECASFFQHLRLSSQEKIIGGELLKEIKERLSFLLGVGLHYLTLERSAPTLSGGESQRVRLASQIGSGLVGATYVLDEPSIGLHPRDNIKLLEMLKNLKDKGNTVIVVEHDEETIKEADYVVDVGPQAGQNGGHIVAQGSVDAILHHPESITGQYLSGKLKIAIPKKRRAINKKETIVLKKASHHNLKNVTVTFPLHVLIGVTGVSGSGKSSLISDTLFPALSNPLNRSELKIGKVEAVTGIDQVDKVICIDQSPIGRSPRSNPATYIKLFDEIRDLFSKLPESTALGYTAGRFSFNVKEGSCPHCGGNGMIRIDMDFMEDEWVTCVHCKGKRFDQNTLAITFKGKNIADVLEMSVSEALEFFSSIPQIKGKLDLLLKVGLNYLKLGQPSPTVSGGEAQRIKLAKELARPSTGKTFYILDEPTTGLHFHDINKLVGVLHSLVDKGNTVLVIEHNMDLIKTADWIIDLGPEGGSGGGQIIAEGPPEKIAKLSTPTGTAIKIALDQTPYTKGKTSAKDTTVYNPFIRIEGASQNNLKHVSVEIPRGKITLCTGPSGSGKSSFAFETIYSEGQRRYIESLSAYARQFVKQMPKPKVENIEGLSASIAIEQKHHAGNPRSTLGTITETYDYLRVLFAHLGVAYCPETGEEIKTISKEYVLNKLMELPSGTKVHILAPLTLRKQDTFAHTIENLQKQGYLRIRLNGTYYELDEEIPFEKGRKNALFLVMDRIGINAGVEKRLFDAIDQATMLSEGTLVAALENKDLFFNLAFAAPSSGKSYPPITPHTFSFNTEQGMCLDCLGLGFQYGANLSRHKEIMKLTPLGLMYLLWKEYSSKEAITYFIQLLKEEGIDPKTPLKDLSSPHLQFFLYGKKEEGKLSWMGLNTVFAKLSKTAPSNIKEMIIPLLEENMCISCQGTRLNPLARNVKINALSIADVCALPIEDSCAFISSLSTSPFLKDTFDQLKQRLAFLKALGLGYLSLDRGARTLSGGETQRTYLSRQLGSGLTGCLYVLDEPTIGLHPHNNALLNKALQQLCEAGNTLILVEHDPMTMKIADYILDFGPGAGKEGGRIIAKGTLEEIKNNPASLTGQYLSGKRMPPIPEKRRKLTDFIHLKNAKIHNLKNLNLDFPLKALTCITGVSGSGKSTLLSDLLKPALERSLQQKKREDSIEYLGAQISGLQKIDKLVVLEQSPIGQTNRADLSTYTDLLTPLRYFFASLPSAKAKGLLPKHFSFNHKKGMCMKCQGHGTRTIQLQFLPSVKVTCEACQGYRFNPVSLEVHLKGKHLGHILNMTVKEALSWLPFIPKIHRTLETLMSVGLSYLKLDQEIQTLSGGEAQRLRLSKELAKRQTGKTLYLFDEPTTGLHSIDIEMLLNIFKNLVDKGNTVIIIEHNLDVIAFADHLIDLGPDAGKYGGELIATGTPEEVAHYPHSYTGKYLKEHLYQTTLGLLTLHL